jgi:hypothetical protein
MFAILHPLSPAPANRAREKEKTTVETPGSQPERSWTMATHALPSSHILDDDGAPATATAPSRPSFMRRLTIAVLVAQTRRAQSEIDRVLGPRKLAFRAELPPGRPNS